MWSIPYNIINIVTLFISNIINDIENSLPLTNCILYVQIHVHSPERIDCRYPIPRMFSFFVMIMCILSFHSFSIRIRMRIGVLLWYSVTLSVVVLLHCSISVCGCSSWMCYVWYDIW